MKYIQSYWVREDKTTQDKKLGWLSRKHHLLSLIWSYNTITKFYPKLELFTDSHSAELLEKKLGLKYYNINTCFDKIPFDYPALDIASKKLYTFSLQNEPFCHIDTDIGLYKSFTDKYINSEIIVQNTEVNFTPYISALREIKNKFTEEKSLKLPEILDITILPTNPILAYNTGLFGGSNLDFINKYSNFGFEFLSCYYPIIERCKDIGLDIIIEQYFLSILAHDQKVPITCYTDQPTTDEAIPEFFNFTGLPDNCDYIHIMGAKKFPTTCEQLEQRVKIDYPEQYEALQKLLRDQNITIHTRPEAINEKKETIHPFYRTVDCLAKLNTKLPALKADTVEELHTIFVKIVDKIKIEKHHKVLTEVVNFEYEKINFLSSLPEKSIVENYKHNQSVKLNQALLDQKENDLMLSINPHTLIVDHDWNWVEPLEFRIQENRKPFHENLFLPADQFRIVLFVYPGLETCREYLCNDLEILIINEFVENEKVKWSDLIDNVVKELEVETSEQIQTIRFTIREKLKYLVYQQALALV